jgi:membrane-associated phospholipid phosphatase
MWKALDRTSIPERLKRLIGLGMLLGGMLLYWPINRVGRGGLALETALDRAIPLWPVWVIPYLGVFLALLLLLIAVYQWMPYRMFQAFISANLIAFAVSYAIYLVFPTYANRPPITGGDPFSAAIRWLYRQDRAYNAFPSGHTYMTVIAWLFLWRWQPRLRVVFSALAGLVVLSTLFTKQHNLADLLGGVALAAFSYWLGWKATGESRPDPDRS